MESKNILLFQPVRTTWHQCISFRNRPVVVLSAADSVAKKIAGNLLNGLKKRIVEIAMVIATIFAVVYSLITFPFRWSQSLRIEREGIALDLARFTPKERNETEEQVLAYFEKHEKDFANLSAREKEETIQKVVSQCARSQKIYGPVVRHWVDHLLEKANREHKKLVFMARDGIPYYQVAMQLMKKPEYQAKYPYLMRDNSIVLGYFSRIVVEEFATENKDLFHRYVSEELKIEPGDSCLFIDIGFSGRMVPTLRGLLPDNTIDFHFLVATSDRAEGFLGTPENPLPHLKTAANNLGVRWAEETHHGPIASPKKLVEGDDGRVHPNSLFPKKVRDSEKFSLEYLIQKFCLRRLVAYAADMPPVSSEQAVTARDAFDDTIGKIKNMELPIFLGWDY